MVVDTTAPAQYHACLHARVNASHLHTPNHPAHTKRWPYKRNVNSMSHERKVVERNVSRCD